ncbi:MAG: hypothetical protein KJO80_03105 [Gammaproteobacteria bacterium]|nr:hypothetical protein [Gammaproteobacteria bacterium]NNL00440.1 hypothetical protein [Xanthomonadales bacterium]
MSKFRLLLACLGTILLLAGCTSLAYNRLDWLIPWYVDGYVDLTSEQRKLLRNKLTSPLDWHRQEELANYIDILNSIEADLDGEVTAETVRRWADEMFDAAVRVQRSLLAVALEFGTQVSDEQVEEFVVSLWERHEEMEEELRARSYAEYTDDDYDSLVETLQRFLGRLSVEQKAILREASNKLVRFDKAWLDEGRAWLKKMENLLQREAGWQEAIMQAYDARASLRSAEYRAAFEHNMGLVTQAYAEVIGKMSEKQRKKAQNEFDDLRRMLTRLMDDD